MAQFEASDPLVFTTECRHPASVTAAKQAKAVADQLANRSQSPLCEALNGAVAEAADAVQLQPHWLVLRRGLDRSQEERLAGQAIVTDSPRSYERVCATSLIAPLSCLLRACRLAAPKPSSC